MAAFDQGTLSKYNSLTDRHLVSYFSNERMRHHLIKNGLITKTGEVIPDAVYRVRMARREHRRRVRNLIAQAIIHKALEMERSRQIDIRKKIEEIAKIELVRRVREDRIRIGDEDCTPYFNPGNMEISGKSALEKKRTQSEIEEYALSPTPEEKSRLRLRKLLPTDEIESKHLSQLDSLTLGEYSKILQQQDRERINRLPYLGFGTDFNRNRRKQARLKKIKKKQKKQRASSKDELLNSGRNAPSRLQSMTKLSFLFHAPKNNRPYEVMVEQQPSGGNTLTLFRETLTSNSVFCIVSQRHRGFPFSLTFYINNVKDSRISTCCEFKHKVGKEIGGPNGHFRLFSVEDATPCYKCRTEQDMINERKNRKGSKASEQETNYHESVSVHQNSENFNDTEDEFQSVSDSESSDDSENDEVENVDENEVQRSSSKSSTNSSITLSEKASKTVVKSDSDGLPDTGDRSTDSTPENRNSPFPANSNNNAMDNSRIEDCRQKEREIKSPSDENKVVMKHVEKDNYGDAISKRRLSNNNNNNVNIDEKNTNVRKNSISKEKRNEKHEANEPKVLITHIEKDNHGESITKRRLSNNNNAVIDSKNKDARKNSISKEKTNDKHVVVAQMKDKSGELTITDEATRKSSFELQHENEIINIDEDLNYNGILEMNNSYEDKQRSDSIFEEAQFEDLNNISPPIAKEADNGLPDKPVKRLSISSPNTMDTENRNRADDILDNKMDDIVHESPQSVSNSRSPDLKQPDHIQSNNESFMSKNDNIVLGVSDNGGGGSNYTRLEDADGNEQEMKTKIDSPLLLEEAENSSSIDGFDDSDSSASNLMNSSGSSHIKNSRDVTSDVDRIKSPNNFDENELKIALPNDDNESSKPTNSDRPLGDRDHEGSDLSANDKIDTPDVLEMSNKGRASKLSFSSTSSTEYETDSDDNELFHQEDPINENKSSIEKMGETEPSEGSSVIVEDDDINFKRAKEISQLFENVKVDSIKLKNCELPSYVFNFIADKLGIHQELKIMELSGCEVEISLLNLLAKDLKNWPNLEQLILSENQFTDYSLQNLIDMIKFLYDNGNEKVLKLFDLSNCSIQPNDLEQLIDMIGKNTKLERFILSGNPLSPSILQELFLALQRNSHIQMISIENCGVSQSVLDELDEQLRKDIETRLKF